MDSRLQNAAMRGDIEGLNKLLEEDPLLLEVILPPFTNNALHIAAFKGKTEFGRRLVSLSPELAFQQGGQGGQTPLHMAAGAGYVEFVSMLIDELGQDLALVGDSHENTPLHYVAAKGNVNVVKCLVDKNKEAIRRPNSQGETPLDLAMRCNQVGNKDKIIECLKDDDLDALKPMTAVQDDGGSTILQFSTSTGQNKNYVGSQGHRIMNIEGGQTLSRRRASLEVDHPPPRRNLIAPEDALRVVGSLIASVTFQAAISPPSILYYKDGIEAKFHPHEHSLNCSFFYTRDNNCVQAKLARFLIINAIGFVMSIALLIPSRHPLIGGFFLTGSLVSLCLAHLTVTKAYFADHETGAILISMYASLLLIFLFVNFYTRRLLNEIRVYVSRHIKEAWKWFH